MRYKERQREDVQQSGGRTTEKGHAEQGRIREDKEIE